jgi:DNA-binding CsgD family transcriptional regulator
MQDATAAWFAGDFELCLQLCDGVRLRDDLTRIHVSLLKARALIRLDRLKEAIAVLSDCRTSSDGSDESITTQMLLGVTHVRSDEVDTGLAILRSAQRNSGRVHRTIRSELALHIALGHYCRHDLDAAEQSLHLVEDDTDLVYARAIQYRAWIAGARGNSEQSGALFIQALEAFDRCLHHDRFFEANCLRALAHIAVERLDPRTWDFVRARRARIDWSADSLSEPHFFIAYCAAAYMLDVEGDPLEAAREARRSERIAPNPALRVQARCKRASIARRVGEDISHADHLNSAAELFHELSPSDFAGDAKIVPLVLAEELAGVRCGEARSLFALYSALPPMASKRALAHSPATLAYRYLVEGHILEQSGQTDAAAKAYRSAFSIFKRTGYTRRGTMVALRLWKLTANSDAYAYAVEATSHLSPRAWLRREVEAAKSQTIRLTDVQREVLALICQGKSNPEIARMRKRSLHTVRNLVARLFEIFAVTSREELAVEGVRKGVYTPK